MAQPQVLEGTWEELKLHDQELAGKRFRLVPVPPETDQANHKVRKNKQGTSEERHTVPRQLTGMGKFAGIIPSSEEFMHQKQEEIELEDRKFRK